MPFCNQCGKEAGAGGFCAACGAAINPSLMSSNPMSNMPSSGYSTWGNRALAFLIDAGLMIAVYVVGLLLALILGQISSALGLIVLIITYIAIVGIQLVFLGMQVGETGQSPGMRVIGLKCISQETSQPIGAGMGIVRTLANYINSLACYIGWLFPLWDPQRQTFSDKIMKTVVIDVAKQSFSIFPPKSS